MTARYAIYFAPDPDSPLGRFGASWLGRDAATGCRRPQPSLEALSATRLQEITQTARHYGFHATLKAPFALAPEANASQLHEALVEFSASHDPVEPLDLKVFELDGFLALGLSEDSRAITDLAADCVRGFDGFRAEITEDELRRRRRAPLTPLQDALLLRWGYPYAMEAFRFHMTLTARLDEAERGRVKRILQSLFDRTANADFAIDGVALFFQESRDRPFRMIRRYSLGTAKVKSWDTNARTESSSEPSFDSVTTSSPDTR